jgi:anti-sigma B factor antagonist
MTQLDITVHNEHHRLLLVASGPINSYTFTDFQEKVYKAIAQTDTAVDMERVTALSSAGIGVIMTAMEDAETTGHGFAIVNPSEVVKIALDSTGFGDRFPVVKTLKQV